MDLTCKAIRHGSKLCPGCLHGPCKPPERLSFVRPMVRDRLSAHGESTGMGQGGPTVRALTTARHRSDRAHRKIDDAHPVLPALHAPDALHAQDDVALRPGIRPAHSVRHGYLPERSRMIPPSRGTPPTRRGHTPPLKPRPGLPAGRAGRPGTERRFLPRETQIRAARAAAAYLSLADHGHVEDALEMGIPHRRHQQPPHEWPSCASGCWRERSRRETDGSGGAALSSNKLYMIMYKCRCGRVCDGMRVPV